MVRYTNGLEDTLDLTNSSVTVLEKRYLIKDAHGEIIETAEGMYHRVAKDIAVADSFYLGGLKDKVTKDMPTSEIYSLVENDARIKERENEFFEFMNQGYFTPNSPTLMNAGRDLQQLAACFVLPVPDSIEGIFETIKHTALIHKSGGGTGFDFSRLRPKESYVGTTGGVASGPISFMKIFNAATEQIKQGGTRRGANMGILRVDHPNIEEFIYCKSKGEINNFNISVAITDEFMQAVKENREYDLISPQTGEVSKKLNAPEIYNQIAQQAWETGDPGIVFIDEINRNNPTPEIGNMEATNPCGEQPLLPYESCNLGSLNLGKFVEAGKLDKNLLEKIIRGGTRFLDNVIDRGRYPLPQIQEMVQANRKIGLGVMGFADCLSKMNISYNSSEAVKEAENIMKLISDTANDESRILAKERGAFPNFEKSVYKNGEPIRNATRTTIAPTGTISIINNSASSGIEPVFAIVQKRNVGKSLGEDLIEMNQGFKTYLEKKGLYSEHLIKKFIDEEGKIVEIEEISELENFQEEIKNLFPSSHDVSPEQHIKIQATFQKYMDNAVSKTVNFPNDATVEDIQKVYNLAHEYRCKGVTVFRDDCREDQVLVGGGKKQGGLETQITLVRNDVTLDPRIDKKPQADKYKVRRKENNDSLHMILTSELYVDEKTSKAYLLPDEVFLARAPLGHSTSVSLAQAGMDRTEIFQGSNPNYSEIIGRFQSASSHEEEGIGPHKIKSVEHAYGLVLEDYCLRNGIVEKNELGKLQNTIQKKNLRKVEMNSQEYEGIMSQIGINKDSPTLTVGGNHGKLGEKFVCEECSGDKYTFSDGCNSPKCCGCGTIQENGCG